MSKLFIIVSCSNGHPAAGNLVGLIAEHLRSTGFEKVSADHPMMSSASHVLEGLTLVLSEHYLSSRVELDHVPRGDSRTSPMRTRVWPPVTQFTTPGLIGISVSGAVNSGKSWVMKITQDALMHRYNVPRSRILTEHPMGTFGWHGDSAGFGTEEMELIRKHTTIEVRLLESTRRADFDYLPNLELDDVQ